MLDFEHLISAEVHKTPYTHLVAREVISPRQAEQIRRDFPDLDEPGFLVLEPGAGKGAFRELVDDLMSARLAEILSDKLEMELAGLPRMVTVLSRSHPGMGRIHTDSESKLCTMLIYLNAAWEGAEGAIRVLNGSRDIGDYAREIPPLQGNVFAFRRSDSSWHGHLPFTGVRHVVQTTFLKDTAELERKLQRGRLQRFLKRFNPLG